MKIQSPRSWPRLLCASFAMFLCVLWRPLSQPPLLLSKSPAPLSGLSLSDDGSALAVADALSLGIRGQDGRALSQLPLAGARFVGFAREQGSDALLLAALAGDGGLSLWDLRGGEASPADITFVEEDGGEPALDSRYTALAFSPDSDYLAAGGGDGRVRLFFKLRHTRRFLSRDMEGLSGRVVALAFSPDSRYLAAASDSGDALLWDCSRLSAVAALPFYAAQSDMPLAFSERGLLAVALDARSIVFYDMAGGQQGSLIVDGDIKAVRFLPDEAGAGETLAVLTAEGRLFFYRLADGELASSVPAAAAAPRTAFAFSSDGSFLYDGYGDGSLFRLPLKDAVEMQDSARERDVGQEVAGGQVAEDGSWQAASAAPAAPAAAPAVPFPEETVAAPVASAAPSPEGEPASPPLPADRVPSAVQEGGLWRRSDALPSRRNSIALSAGGVSLREPYDAAAKLEAVCRLGSFLAPFYFGLALEGQLGLCFDAESFPYEYAWEGEELAPPMTQGLSLYLPLGIQYDLGNSCGVFGELHAGGRELMLFRPYDGGVFRSDAHFVPMAGISLGALFHGLVFQLGVDFDPVQRFTPGVLVGYSIGLPGGGK